MRIVSPEIDVPASGLLAAGKRFHKTVEVFVTIKEGFDEDPLVPAMRAGFPDIACQPGMSVGRYARVAKVTAVGGAGAHDRQHDRTGPELGGQFCDRTDDVVAERGWRAGRRLVDLRDHDLVVG